MDEIWKVIENTYYEVSNTGKVRHVANKIELKGDSVQISHDPRKRERVRRLVYRAFVGEIPDGRNVEKKDNSLPASVDNIYVVEEKQKRKSHTQEILELSVNGLSGTEIAQELGITPGAVTHCLKRHKEKSPSD